MGKQNKQNDLEKLFTKVSENYDIGDFETFKSRMNTPEQRRSFYDKMASENLDLGDYNAYESRLGKSIEVSPSGLENTSQTSVEPGMSSTPQQTNMQEQGISSSQASSSEGGNFVLPQGAIDLTDPERGIYAYQNPNDPLLDGGGMGEVTNVIEAITVRPTQEQLDLARQSQDKGVLSDLKNSFSSGLAQFNQGIASIPEYLYSIAAVPQNLAADAGEALGFDTDWIRARYENIETGTYNPLRLLSDYTKSQKELSGEYANQVTQFENNIIGSIGEGNLLDAGRQVLNSIAGSAPAIVGMVATSGASSAAGLGTVGRSIANALPFASGAYQDIEDNPDMSENTKLLASSLKGLSEVVFEQSFGTTALIEGILNKSIGKEGVESFVKGYMDRLLKSNGIPQSAFKGSISEGATTLAKNIVTKYSGENPDQDLWEGVPDALIVGGLMDASISGGNKISSALLTKSNKNRVAELESQNEALRNDLNTASNPELIQQVIEKNASEMDSLIEVDIEENKNVPQEVRDQVVEINSQIDSINSEIESDVISDEGKVALESQALELEKQADELIKQSKENENTESVSEVPVESVEVSSVGEQAQQTEGVVNEEASQESATKIEETVYDQINREDSEARTRQEASKQKAVEDVDKIKSGDTETIESYFKKSKFKEVTQEDVDSGAYKKERLGQFVFNTGGSATFMKSKQDVALRTAERAANKKVTGISTARNEEIFREFQDRQAKKKTVEPVTETGQQNQNVDAQPDEVITEAVSEEITPAEQTLATEEIIESTPVTEAIQETNNVQENTVQENEQEQVREEVVEESSESTEMPKKEQTNPKLKRLLKSLPRQDIESLRGPANVGYRQDVIESVTGTRPTKKDAGITNVKSVLNEYFGLEDAGSEAARNQAISNWANYERTEFSNPDEAVRYEAENTDNPDDILRLYETEQPVFNEREFRISEYIGDGKINLRGFNNFGDPNNLTNEVAKKRIDPTNSGIDVDIAAQELSEQLGYEITPEEIVDFVTNNPTQESYIESTKSDNQRLLEGRYKELTGRDLTPKALERFAERQSRAVTDAELISSDVDMVERGITPEQVSSRRQMEASEGLSPVSAPLPKSLLKGVSDRLKMTGLATGVKITDSKGVSQELAKRTGGVNFQQNEYNPGTQAERDLFNSFEKKTPIEILDVISEQTSSPEIKRVVDMLKGSSQRLSEFTLMTGDFPWRGLTENGRITVNTNEVFEAPSDLTTKRGLDSAFKTLVHEYVHAVTLSAYRNPRTKADRDFKKYIDSVYSSLKKDAMFKDAMYGFESQTEFIAELMTNNEFRKLGPIQKRGVVGRLIDYIKGILGFNVETNDQANSRRSKLMDEAFEYVLESIPNITQQGGILYQQGDVINGFYDPATGEIVINQETAGLDTPIHEFAHAWEGVIEKENPELHARGMELIQTEEGSPYVDFVRQTQPGLEGNALYKEALAQAIGDSGARLINTQQRSVLKDWLKAAWDYIASRVGISGMTANQISNLTLREFTDAVAVDLLSGKPYVRMPNNDILVETTVSSESAMDEKQKFMADFILRMKTKNGVTFQGNVSGGLSGEDMRDLITFFKYATDSGQINSIDDARGFAESMGINSPGEVDMAYKLSKVESQESTGFKKDQVSAETLTTADFEKMSDEEYREMGRRLVESGQVNPTRLTNDIISNPRALQPWEVTALAYYRSQIDSQMADISDIINSEDRTQADAYVFEIVDGEFLSGYKALAAHTDLLNRRLFDLEVAMLATANQQSAAFRLRSIMSDKDFNIVSYLAEMKANGYVSPEVEARLKALSDELNEVRAKLNAKVKRADKKVSDIEQGNIKTDASRPVKKVRLKKETVDAVVGVLDTIDVSSFGLPGMSFQTNGILRFQTSPNNSVSLAVSEAISKMRDNISKGNLSISDAIESAIQEVNDLVGESNWDSMKFRSTIANQLVQQKIPVKIKKPYVNSNGVLIVPGEYIKDLVRNGNDTIDKIVSAASSELGGRFSNYDIQNAVSGYGRQSGNKRSDLYKKIAYARRVAKLLSQIEDLETKGKRLKTGKQVQANTTEINSLKEKIKTLEYDIEMTPEERAQMDEIKYNEARRKYIINYIAQVQERINNKDFAPVRHENKYEDDAETKELRVEAERIKNEFKKEKYKHELENRSPWEKRKQFLYDVVFNTTRAASAGADLSAIGVQGAIFTAARPKEAAKVFKKALTESFTEEQYDQYFAELQSEPYYDIARKAGLNLQLPNFYQNVQEEQFKGNLPVWFFDKLVDFTAYTTAKVRGTDVKDTQEFARDRFNLFRYADRNYAITLSKIRMDLFKEFLANQINKKGLNVKVDEKEVARLAEVVNTLTMASKVLALQGKVANDIASAIMFSMRKFVATWKILGAWVPLLVGSNRNFQLFKDAYGGVIARGLGTMFLTSAIPAGLAALMYDPEEDEEPPYFYNPYFLEPRHSDFLKIKAGDTRISLFQGIDGNIVFATRQIMGEYMTSSSKAVRELSGQEGNKSRLILGWDYISNKFAPTTSILVGFAGSDREKQESYDRFQQSILPMWASGIKEQYENTGDVYETSVLATLGILGLSYNNYGGAEFAKSRGTDNKKAQSIFDKSGLAAYDPASGQRKYFDGEDIVKVSGSFYKDKYLPEYQKFMTEAVVSNQNKLEQNINWEIKEGVVDQLKKEAYKYAEIKSSGVAMGVNFYSFSNDGTKYRILKSQYPIKAKYIQEYMDKEASRDKREARTEVAIKLRTDKVNATDAYKSMLEEIYLYNKANKYANEKLVEDVRRRKIKLIKQAEYYSDMDSPDWDGDTE